MKTIGYKKYFQHEINMLNHEQEKVCKNILEFLNPSNKINIPFYRLEAPAGAGKSFTVQVALTEALQRGYVGHDRVCFAFPTNKLRNFFGKKLEGSWPASSVKTIFKLLRFFPYAMSEDRSVLTSMATEEEGATIPPFDVVVLDEAFSYDKRLIEAIFKVHSVKWIFLGDSRQLPPIGCTISPLKYCTSNYFAFDDCLTIIERQNNIELAQTVEEILEKGYNYEPNFKEKRANQFLHQEIIPDILKGKTPLVLAYQNRTVDDISKTILTAQANHLEVPETSHPVYFPGANLTISGLRLGGKTLVPANDNITVDRYDGEEQKVYFTYDCDTFSALVWTPERYERAKAKAEERIRNDEVKNPWGKFQNDMAKLVKGKSAYSSTIHSSQGMTAETVYLAWNDLKWGRDIKDQLAYVAASRAADRLEFLR